MRLTCPNCSAQYEVPDEVIPEEGRDVQCSNCDTTWYQAKHPSVAGEADDSVVVAPAPQEEAAQPPAAETANDISEPAAKPEDKPAQDSNIAPDIASILREEAEREASLRATEGGGLESQPDLALHSDHIEPEFEIKQTITTETAADAGQKDALPDVDAINSSLRGDDIVRDAGQTAVAPRKSGGFMRGFALMVIVGIILFLVYGNAATITEAVPAAEPALQSYTSFVDQLRVWIATQTGATGQ